MAADAPPPRADADPSVVDNLVRALKAATWEGDQVAVLRTLGACFRARKAFNAARRRLRSPRPAVAREAALTLGRLGLAGAVPHLVRVARDLVHPARCEAVGSLGTLGRRETLNFLAGLALDARDRAVAAAAATALGDLLVAESAAPLARVLVQRAGEDDVVAAAVEAWGRVARPTLVPELPASVLGSPSEAIRRAARLAEERLVVVAALLSPDDVERAVDQVLDAYALDRLPEVRLARNLRRFAPERLLRAVERCIDQAAGDSARLIRICRLLRVYESAAGLPALERILSGAATDALHEEAAAAIAGIGGDEALLMLRRALGSPELRETRRLALIDALGELHRPGALDVLVEELVGGTEPSRAVAHAACRSLCSLLSAAEGSAQSTVARLVAKARPGLAQNIAWLLGELRLGGFEPSLARALAAGPRDGNNWAAWALGEVGTDAAVSALLEALAQARPDSKHGQGIIMALGKALAVERDRPAARTALLDLLGRESDEATVRTLLWALVDARCIPPPALLLPGLRGEASGATRQPALELLRHADPDRARAEARRARAAGDAGLRSTSLRVLCDLGDPADLLRIAEDMAAGDVAPEATGRRFAEVAAAFRRGLAHETVRWTIGIEGMGARLDPADVAGGEALAQLRAEARLLLHAGGAARGRASATLAAEYGPLWAELGVEMQANLVTAAAVAAPVAEGGHGEADTGIALLARAAECAVQDRLGGLVHRALVERGLPERLREARTDSSGAALAERAANACAAAGLHLKRSQVSQVLNELAPAEDLRETVPLSGLRRWAVLLALAGSGFEVAGRSFAEWLAFGVDAAALAPLLGRLRELNAWRNDVIHASHGWRSQRRDVARAGETCRLFLDLVLRRVRPAVAETAPGGAALGVPGPGDARKDPAADDPRTP